MADEQAPRAERPDLAAILAKLGPQRLASIYQTQAEGDGARLFPPGHVDEPGPAISADLQATGEKTSQAEARYTDESPFPYTCEACKQYGHYRCHIVEGEIDPGGWCVLWERNGVG